MSKEMLQNTTSKLVIGGGRWSVDQTIKSIAGPKSIGFIYTIQVLTLYK